MLREKPAEARPDGEETTFGPCPGEAGVLPVSRPSAERHVCRDLRSVCFVIACGAAPAAGTLICQRRGCGAVYEDTEEGNPPVRGIRG